MPSEKEIAKQSRRIIVKAYETSTVDQLTKRLVRKQLQEHFGVDLENQKSFINKTVQLQVNEVGTSHEATVGGLSAPPKRTAGSASAKGKQIKKRSSTANQVEVPDESPAHVSDVSAHDEEEYEFSELEDGESSSKKSARASKPPITKKSRSSTGKSGAASRSNPKPGQNEAEQRLIRLKSLVVACGIRKPWKKLYEEASVDAEDFQGQCRVVQRVLSELGMKGRGSIEQAKKIRDQREFADELAELADNKVETSPGRGGRQARRRAAVDRSIIKDINEKNDDSGDDDDSEFGSSTNEEPQTSKRKAESKSKNISSDSESEDEVGPPKRKLFKSSLASFAADLNSDSD